MRTIDDLFLEIENRKKKLEEERRKRLKRNSEIDDQIEELKVKLKGFELKGDFTSVEQIRGQIKKLKFERLRGRHYDYELDDENKIYECPECGTEVNEEDSEFVCPFCGDVDIGDGFYICEDCGTIFDCVGDLWECECCYNEGISEEPEKISQQDDEDEEVSICPDCGCVLVDSSYCYDCGWPNNQAWAAEHMEPFYFHHR